MDRQKIVAAAQDLVRAGRAFVLGTVDETGTPQMRWMGAAHLEEPLTVYMVSGAGSRKVHQIAAQQRSQLMFQSEDYSRVATLSGTCELVTDMQVKRNVWEGIPAAAKYFSGPEDEKFGVIRFECKRAEVVGIAEGMEAAVAEL
jgi:general stress protein 26